MAQYCRGLTYQASRDLSGPSLLLSFIMCTVPLQCLGFAAGPATRLPVPMPPLLALLHSPLTVFCGEATWHANWPENAIQALCRQKYDLREAFLRLLDLAGEISHPKCIGRLPTEQSWNSVGPLLPPALDMLIRLCEGKLAD